MYNIFIIAVTITIIITSLEALDLTTDCMCAEDLLLQETAYNNATSTIMDNAYNYPVNHSRILLRNITGGGSVGLNNVNPYWVTGFTDAEGSFGISTSTSGNNLKVSLQFKVTQNNASKDSLLNLVNYFDSGNVVRDKGDALKFQVQDLNTILNKILPHFDKHPLKTSKYLDYEAFKKVAHILSDKGHTQTEGKQSIFTLKSQMNTQRPDFERWNYLKSSNITIDSNWLSGFIDGEGSFQYSLSERISRNSTYVHANPTLEIAQSSHDVAVLDAIRNFLNSGYIKPKYDINSWLEVTKNRSVSRYINNKEEAVINLIDKYPLQTIKKEDYNDWKTLISMKNDGLQKTKQGFVDMQKIKASMNSGRSTKSA